MCRDASSTTIKYKIIDGRASFGQLFLHIRRTDLTSSTMASEFDYWNGGVLMFLSVCSTLVNVPLLTFLLIGRKESDDDVIPMIMFSLAISDLLAGSLLNGLTAIFAWIRPVVIPNVLLTIQGSIWHGCTFVSIWHLALMSSVKCYVICRPMTYVFVVTDKLRNVMVAAIWLANAVMLIGAYLGGVRWIIDPRMSIGIAQGNPTTGRGLRYFETYVMMVVPSAMIIVVYSCILWVVRKHHITIGVLNPGTAEQNPSGHIQSWTTSVRSARSLFILCLAYYICYIPSQMTNLGFAWPTWYEVGSRWVLYSSSVVNGLLYILLNKSTRRRFAKLLCARCGQPTIVSVMSR